MRELERELEAGLEAELARLRERFRYRLQGGRARFEARSVALHESLRRGVVVFLREAPLASLLVAPVIYSLIVPLLLLDAWTALYQAVCFRAYGIAKVPRAGYFIYDRGRLGYLNAIERLNCDYCAYANGLLAYVREVGSRTEQYFCPIKHARRRLAEHARYEGFCDFGDAEAYRRDLPKLRDEIE